MSLILGIVTHVLSPQLPAHVYPITAADGPRRDVNCLIQVPRYNGVIRSAALTLTFRRDHTMRVENLSDSYIGPVDTVDGLVNYFTWLPEVGTPMPGSYIGSAYRATRRAGHYLPRYDGALDFAGSSGWTVWWPEPVKTHKVTLSVQERASFVGTGYQDVWLHPVGFDSLRPCGAFGQGTDWGVWQNTLDIGRDASLTMTYEVE